MNIPRKAAITIATIVSIGLLSQTTTLEAQNKPQESTYVKKAPYSPPVPIIGQYAPNSKGIEAIQSLTHNQKEWLTKMIGCESGGRPGIINPKDKDNTPSYGLLQFKPATFYGYAKQYGVPVTGYMNPDEQVQIMAKLMAHAPEINWFIQFPMCTKKNGQPPAN